MTLVMRVGGVAELVEGFDDLARTTRNRLMRIGMNAGAGVIKNAAVSNIDSKSGLLRKSIKIKVKVPDASFNKAHHGRPAYAVIGPSRKVQGRVATVNGRVKTLTTRQAIKRTLGGGGFITRRPARYAHLVHGGTKAHSIHAKNARVLSDGTTVFGTSVRHPGTSGNQFLSRAVRSSGGAAKAKMIGKIKDGIGQWAARRAAKARTQYAIGA